MHINIQDLYEELEEKRQEMEAAAPGLQILGVPLLVQSAGAFPMVMEVWWRYQTVDGTGASGFCSLVDNMVVVLDKKMTLEELWES